MRSLHGEPLADNPLTSSNLYPLCLSTLLLEPNQARAAHSFFAFSAPRPGFAGTPYTPRRTTVFGRWGRVGALCARSVSAQPGRPLRPWSLNPGRSGLCMTAASGSAAVSVPHQGTRGVRHISAAGWKGRASAGPGWDERYGPTSCSGALAGGEPPGRQPRRLPTTAILLRLSARSSYANRGFRLHEPQRLNSSHSFGRVSTPAYSTSSPSQMCPDPAAVICLRYSTRSAWAAHRVFPGWPCQYSAGCEHGISAVACHRPAAVAGTDMISWLPPLRSTTNATCFACGACCAWASALLTLALLPSAVIIEARRHRLW